MIVGTSATTQIRLVVTGSEGRMSSTLRAVSRNDQRFVLLETMGIRGCTELKSQGKKHPDNADVIVDFTTEEGTAFALQIASQESCAFLVGTTGLSPGIIDKIENFAAEHPVMIAPNTSLGAVVMRFLSLKRPGFFKVVATLTLSRGTTCTNAIRLRGPQFASPSQFGKKPASKYPRSESIPFVPGISVENMKSNFAVSVND